MMRSGVRWRLFLTCWMVFAVHFATNIVREHYPAFSLAERGTLRVDPYLGLHPDLFEIEGRGAFINNNPGASIVGAIPYALLRPLVDLVVERVRAARATSGQPLTAEYHTHHANSREFFKKVRARGLDVRFGLASGVIHLLCMAPLSALAVVVMYGLLLRVPFPPAAALVMSLLYGFATPVFLRTGFLNQNLLIAHFALFAFALLWQPAGGLPPARERFAAGFLTGMTLLCDYSAVVVVPAIGIYAWWRAARESGALAALRAQAVVVGGAALPVAGLLAYQAWAFGNPLWPAQFYMPATSLSVEGWNSVSWPAPDLLAANLLDLRFGLFSSSPLLVLALAVPFLPARARRRLGAAEVALALGMFAGMWLFCSAIGFARLQFNTGVRYLVPCVPFLFLAAAPVLFRLPRVLAGVLAVLCTAEMWCLAMVREGIVESVRSVVTTGIQLPWLSTLARMGGQYEVGLAAAPPDPSFVLVVLAALNLVLWWPFSSSGRAARW